MCSKFIFQAPVTDDFKIGCVLSDLLRTCDNARACSGQFQFLLIEYRFLFIYA